MRRFVLFFRLTTKSAVNLLSYQIILQYAFLAHQFLEAVDVFLRDAATDVDADAVVLADGDIAKIVADAFELRRP